MQRIWGTAAIILAGAVVVAAGYVLLSGSRADFSMGAWHGKAEHGILVDHPPAARQCWLPAPECS